MFLLRRGRGTRIATPRSTAREPGPVAHSARHPQPIDEMSAQLPRVVLGAVDEARLAAAHEVEPQHVQPKWLQPRKAA